VFYRNEGPNILSCGEPSGDGMHGSESVQACAAVAVHNLCSVREEPRAVVGEHGERYPAAVGREGEYDALVLAVDSVAELAVGQCELDFTAVVSGRREPALVSSFVRAVTVGERQTAVRVVDPALVPDAVRTRVPCLLAYYAQPGVRCASQAVRVLLPEP